MRAGRGAERGKAAEAKPGRDAELDGQGWTRRTTIDEPRLSELVQMYRELGFQVLMEPVGLMAEGECQECLSQDPDRYRTIYTRPRGIV